MREKLKRLLSPPPWATLLVVTLAVLLLCLTLSRDEKSFLTYFSYAFSTFALVIGTGEFAHLCRSLNTAYRRSRFAREIRKHDVVARYLDDPIFRTKWSLYFGTLINMLYVFVKLFSGLLFHSEWLVLFALYYAVLTVLRLSLINYIRRHPKGENLPGEYRRYRLIGILLLLMNVVLSMIVVRMIRNNEAYEYPGVLIYAMAAYTFYLVIVSIINVFRFRQHGSPVYSAVKIVNLTAAIVAMLSLAAAMISRFGAADDQFRMWMLGTSGLIASVIIVLMSASMVLKANRKLKRLQD
ncbi:MAG: hypothetical protein K6C08_00420 [Oscillospiraceae bacterium]|nr:hypothetical protein [Oscillospiraceae bacterium]